MSRDECIEFLRKLNRKAQRAMVMVGHVYVPGNGSLVANMFSWDDRSSCVVLDQQGCREACYWVWRACERKIRSHRRPSPSREKATHELIDFLAENYASLGGEWWAVAP